MAPVHHHHIGIAGRDQRVDERHPGRTRPDDQIVGLNPAHGRILRPEPELVPGESVADGC